MAKKIILTEEQLIRIASLINEDFDSHIYDLILDKYNEVGIEGMGEDEVAYLKSGGETEIPTSFKEPEKKYDIDLGGEYGEDDDEDVNRLIQTLDEIIDVIGMDVIDIKKLNDTEYVLIMPYDEEYYNLMMKDFGGEDAPYTKVLVDKKFTQMGISIPTSWHDKLFGANRL